MGKSLQDQLIGAGLVTKGQAKKVRQEKRKKRKARGNKPPPPDAVKARIVREAAEKARRDRELERRRSEAQETKARQSQVEQMIDAHRIDREEGDVAHRFVVEGKVKQIYVSAAQHAALADGRLRIAIGTQRYELVDAAAARKIAERAPAAIVEVPRKGADDDGYDGFEVPDDLMW